ncbi:MAG: hypothetical protein OER95_12100 [Acidimicrobiia bacterium]|nr:hypothetical protein [Acidimicrobiia bacterium]
MERAQISDETGASSAGGNCGDAWPLSTARLVLSTVGWLIGIGLVSGCLSSGNGTEAPQVLSPREAAEELISGPMATEVGLGDLTVSCPEMNGATAGDVFPCTAATEAQRVINVDAAILPSGQVELTTTNVITGDALPSFEVAAVNALNATLDVTLLPEAIDCGDTSVVLADDRMMICALTDPTTLQVFDVSLTIDDIETRQFSLVVANQPRS